MEIGRSSGSLSRRLRSHSSSAHTCFASFCVPLPVPPQYTPTVRIVTFQYTEPTTPVSAPQ